MNLRVALLRHGKTEGNLRRQYIGRTDEPLCEAGIEQINQKIAADNYPPADFVYVSPMRRCMQTMALIYPEVPFAIVPELVECNFGIFEGKSYEELHNDAAYCEWLNSGCTSQIPGGESRASFAARCCTGFEQSIRQSIEQNHTSIAFVIHGGSIMALMDRYCSQTASFHDWQVKNGEGYIVEIDTDSWPKSHIISFVKKS